MGRVFETRECDVPPDLMKKLRELETKKKAVYDFVQYVINHGGQLQQEYQIASQAIWQEVAKATGADMVNTVYGIHPTENKIIPLSANFSSNDSPKRR